jgi:3,4-dihydroxy-2-butanone 4-phosphate synthase
MIHVKINRPGHVFPLRAREGGVLTRDGHTEATLDLCRLAGLPQAGILSEIITEDCKDMARMPEIEKFSRDHGLVKIPSLPPYLV